MGQLSSLHISFSIAKYTHNKNKNPLKIEKSIFYNLDVLVQQVGYFEKNNWPIIPKKKSIIAQKNTICK
jgi:hypothetical protein